MYFFKKNYRVALVALDTEIIHWLAFYACARKFRWICLEHQVPMTLNMRMIPWTWVGRIIRLAPCFIQWASCVGLPGSWGASGGSLLLSQISFSALSEQRVIPMNDVIPSPWTMPFLLHTWCHHSFSKNDAMATQKCFRHSSLFSHGKTKTVKPIIWMSISSTF